MNLPLLDQLGEWNPQLFRELKGRLKPRNIFIAVAISLVGQLLLLLYFAASLPVDGTNIERHRYCTGSDWKYYEGASCLIQNGKLAINWQLWWQDVFLALSAIGIFALLVVGTYMLIGDLAQEERRGTLNFVRLSPQSTESVLGGKLLGVPILLYLVAGLAFPLHLWSGLVGNISLGSILSVYAVGLTSCLFFYSAALLFSFVSSWLGGFQVWLGSGAVLIFLMGVFNLISFSGTNSLIDWLFLFSPFTVIRYALSPTTLSSVVPSYQLGSLPKWQWFYIPLGTSAVGAVSFTVLNYGLWSYFIWQGLKRCFRNPNATILSKGQSYLMTASFEFVALGFAVQKATEWSNNPKDWLFFNLFVFSFCNLLLLLGLIAALSPQRQALQDWSRYQQVKSQKAKGTFVFRLLPSWVQDLIWGEKSPAILAVVLNLAIATIAAVGLIVLTPAEIVDKTNALLSLPVFASLVIIYAVTVQLMLLMKTRNRMFWAAGTVGAAILLPLIIFAVLSIAPDKNPALWLFSAFPLFATYYGQATPTTVFLPLLGQWSILGLLLLQLGRQLKQAGESASKAMLAGRASSR